MQEKDYKERDRMSFEGFRSCICLNIQHSLNVKAKIQEVVKVNDVKWYGLVIMAGSGNVEPIIFLEAFYDEYLQGRTLEEIEQDIIEIYRENRHSCQSDAESFRDWNWVKKRIVFSLINMGMNREYLKKVPYVPCLDLAVVFRCFLDSEANIPIHNSYLERWGITKDELYAVAMENTPKLFPSVIKGMGEFIGELIGCPCDMASPVMESLYVLSTQYRQYGAASLLYKDVLKEFADRQGTDLYILPSSIHDVVIVPVTGEINPVRLDEMVRIVNAECLSTDEILSDHMYKYVRETEQIIMWEEKEDE